MSHKDGKKGQSLSKAQKAREELVQYLAQKKSNDLTTESSSSTKSQVKDKRKLVRILHNHHIEEENILNELHQNESDYIERISSLKTYQSITKQTQKEKLYQTEWMDEQLRLQNLSFKLHQSMSDTLQSLLLNDVTMAGVITDLLSLQETSQSSRQEMKTMYTQQLKDIQNLLKDYTVTASNRQKKNDKDEKEKYDPTEEEQHDQSMIISSIFADLLMKLRLDFQNKSIELEKEEDKYNEEVKEAYNNIQYMIHNDLLQQQNQLLTNNLKNIFNEIDIKDIINFNKSIYDDHFSFMKTTSNPTPNPTTDEQPPTLTLSTDKAPSSSLDVEEMAETFIVLNSPRDHGSMTNRSKASPKTSARSFTFSSDSPRPISPSQQLKSTVMDIIQQFSNTSNDSTISSEEKEKLQLLLQDIDIAPVVYRYLHQIYVMDEDYQRSLQEKQQEKVKFHQYLGLPSSSTVQDEEGFTRKMEEEVDELSVSLNTPGNKTITSTITGSHLYGNFPNKTSHEIFVKVYRKAEVTGMLRKTMIEILLKELSPYHLTLDDILIHEEWYRKMKTIQSKYKQIELQYITKRKEIIHLMKEEIKQIIQEKKEKLAYDQEILLLNAKRQVLYEQLQEMKELRDEKQRREAESLQKKLKEEEKLEEIKQKLLQQEKEKKKKILYDYYQEKQLLEKKQKELLNKQKEEENMKLKLLIETNRSKVQFRQQKLNEKQLQKKLLEVIYCCNELIFSILLSFYIGSSSRGGEKKD